MTEPGLKERFLYWFYGRAIRVHHRTARVCAFFDGGTWRLMRKLYYPWARELENRTWQDWEYEDDTKCLALGEEKGLIS